jgi:transcription elongation factor Elf1
VERTCDCTLTIECPYCGRSQSVSITALVLSGSVPRERHACEACGQSFSTEATLEVSVEQT